MMNHPPEQATGKKKAYFLGLLIGFLPILSLCLLIIDRPSDVVGIFFIDIPASVLDNRSLKIPLACIALFLFIWASFKLHKSGRITEGEQCALVFIATLIAVVKFWIFMQQLGQALRSMTW